MKFIDKRSKLIGTIGPSSETLETLEELVKAGMTTIRTNFSHGSREEQKRKFDLAREVTKKLKVPVSVLLDTKGPEIRVGKMKDGAQLIKEDTKVKVWTTNDKYLSFEGTDKEITVSYDMDKDLEIGNKVLFDDGKLVTKVIEKGNGYVVVESINNHLLKSNKRINLPGVEFSLPFLSEKDKGDVIFGIENNIDYIAASFVNSGSNVRELRKLAIENGGEKVKIFSKIESMFGVNNIDEIIKESDGVMIARGDLGLEIPYYDVPFYQKQIIRKCREAGKPVIVATQMLDSMEKSPQPTRAEVTDVYWATELGADATMLSGESASGDFPIEATKVMSIINRRAEKEFYKKLYYPVQMEAVYKYLIDKNKGNKEAIERIEIAYKIAKATQKGEYKYVVVRSTTGKLLDVISQLRPNSAIIGIVADKDMITKFGITNSVFVSLDCVELFDAIKKDFNVAKDALAPFFPQNGDKYLVADKHKIEEKIYN